MPPGGKRKGAGRPKFNDNNPTTYWVVINMLLEIERDGLGRYQRKMARQRSFSEAKKVGTPIEIAALEAIRNTVELKEEIGRLTLELARLRKSDPGAVEIGQLSADLEETRDVSVPDAWREKSESRGMRVPSTGCWSG